MNLKDVRKQNMKDLEKTLEKSKKDLQKVVGDLLQKKEKNVKKAGLLRKDVARVKTVMRELKLKEISKNE